MAEDNKLGRKITTLREAHHLTCRIWPIVAVAT